MEKNADGISTLLLNTREGAVWVLPGDWVIRGADSEHRACGPEVFAAAYESVEII